MPPQKAGLTLLRFADAVPDEFPDDDAAIILHRGMQDHGLKVYVRKPGGVSVLKNGFPHRGPLFMHPLMAMPFPTGSIKEDIAEAKRRGPVIDYGMEEPDIEFLELNCVNVTEIASNKLAQVHWFVGEALRSQKDGLVTAASEFIPLPPCRRCLRPSNDLAEMMGRRDFGGALKDESDFTYDFRIHDLYVDASGLELLQFVTDTPKKRDDPFGLCESSFAVYWAYQAAKKFRVALRNKTKRKEDVIQWLKEQSPKSPYKINYVADKIFKYINPSHRRGRGSKVPPFDGETLLWFRNRYPDEQERSDGLCMIISASIWWSKEHGRYVRGELRGLPITSDVHRKLQQLGFNGHLEIKAITEVIAGRRGISSAQARSKTKSEKKPKMRKKPRISTTART